MAINKNGIITTPTLCESSGMNLVIPEQIGSSFQYTPSTINNSLLLGYTVDLTSLKPDEKIYCRILLEWNGFDTSNTDGTFDMFFQGNNFKISTNSWVWEGRNVANSVIGEITSIVLSNTSGIKILEGVTSLDSSFLETYSKTHFGLRTNYSNGTGWVRISNLEVIPEKYYVSKVGGTSLHIGKDYISAGEIYEI